MKIKNKTTLCTLQCPLDRFLHAWAQKVTKCGTGLHHEPHPTKCRSVDTGKIFGSCCPRCFVDDPYLDVFCRSKSGCGPTNDQAVDSPHNVLTSNAFPDNVLTNVSPNIVSQIVQPVHSMESCWISASVAVSEANWTSVTNSQLMGACDKGVFSVPDFSLGFCNGPCASGAPKWKVKVSALKCRTECRDCWI